ncbi:MAG: Duplicated orphan permease [Gammaproteobacteria bacterium]|nr:Duplicated orphan permease [Gammaproteobacteria bacterium]
MLMNLWFDLKFAWRMLLKAPGYSLLCTVVVALSVGLALWCYVALYNTMLKPLPFPESDSWLSVQIGPKATESGDPVVDAYTYQEVLRHSRTARHLGAFAARAAVLSEGHASAGLRAAAISPGLLAAMQIPPYAGRLFTAADSQIGAAPTVILSFETWQHYFAADPAIIGKQARIDGEPMQIVGVMPQDYLIFQDFEVWLPLRLDTLARPGDSPLILSAFVALGNGQTVTALSNEMQSGVAAVNKSYPDLYDAGRHVELYPAHIMYFHDNVPIIGTINFLAAAVLLLGCLNIGMIFFARLLERNRELALRRALGASRGRLLQQCLLESVFVVLAGLLLGIALASLGVRWASGIGDFQNRIQALGRGTDFTMQPLHLLVAAIAAVVIWLLSTLIPAWRIAKQDAAAVLAGGGKGVATSGSGKTASLLVGVEVAVSSLVLVACANVVFSVIATGNKPTGLNSARVMITTDPTVFDGRYSEPTARLRYWDELALAIRSRMAGAQVAYSTLAPTGREKVLVSIEHAEGTDRQGRLILPLTTVSDNYFDLLGIRLRSGRLFDSTDNSTSLPVAIVDENVATHYWPGQEAVGKRIRVSSAGNEPWLTIVGVVSHVRGRPNSEEEVSYIYRPLRQVAPPAFRVLVKLPTAAADSRVVLRAAAYAVDRDLPLRNLQMFDDYLAALDLEYKSLGPAFSAIAVVTVILAATGLFGLISRSVARRTQEVGVRRALGGTPWNITAMFLRQGLVYFSIGIVGGCLGILVTDFLDATIGNILIFGAWVTLSVFIFIALVIFAASWLPTRRAVALEPADALRYE